MKYLQVNLIYLIITLISFISYIWLQNLRYYHKYDAFFEYNVCIDSKESCFSKKDIIIQGRVLEMDARKDGLGLIRMNDIWIPLPMNQQVSVGDKIKAFGTLNRRLIDGKKYSYWLIQPRIDILSKSSNETLLSPYIWLYHASNIRQDLYMRLRSYMTPTHSSLVAGILFGNKTELSEGFYDALINTGTVHIIVASGYNISIIVTFMTTIGMRFFSRKLSALFTAVGVLAYVLISGVGVPIVRAALMGILLMIAQITGRYYQALWALMIVIALMLSFSPTLIQDVTFQLSVSSTLGILLLNNQLKEFLRLKVYEGISFVKQIIGEQPLINISDFLTLDLSTSLSASIATFPILLIYFDRVNLISPVINALILWTISPLMLLGLVLLMVQPLSVVLAKSVSMFLFAFLTYFTWVVEVFNRASWASLTIKNLNWWFGFGYYFLIIGLLIKFRKNNDV